MKDTHDVDAVFAAAVKDDVRSPRKFMMARPDLRARPADRRAIGEQLDVMADLADVAFRFIDASALDGFGPDPVDVGLRER